jgi:hypothetical protein
MDVRPSSRRAALNAGVPGRSPVGTATLAGLGRPGARTENAMWHGSHGPLN